MKHIAVAVDTLGGDKHSVVVNVAWCIFDEDPKVDVELHFRHVNIENQPNREIDPRAIRWYMEQDEVVREVFEEDGDDLDDVVSDLEEAIKRVSSVPRANRNAMRTLGLKPGIDIHNGIASLGLVGITVYPDFPRADQQVLADVATLRAVWDLTKSQQKIDDEPQA